MDNIRTYSYGCLYITYDMLNNTVLSVENVKEDNMFFNKDTEKYNELNQLLGIDELEQKCKADFKERKYWANRLTISESTIDYFRKNIAKDKDISDDLIIWKIKNQITIGHNLIQFEDQKQRGIQYHRNGNLLFCVKENQKVVSVKWATKKNLGDKLKDIA